MKYSTDRVNNKFKTGRKRFRGSKLPTKKQRIRMTENTKMRRIQWVNNIFIVLEGLKKITQNSLVQIWAKLKKKKKKCCTGLSSKANSHHLHELSCVCSENAC